MSNHLPPKERNARLKSLGNSIVPQVAYQIIEYIKLIDDTDLELATAFSWHR